jgi:hypothetical protein
VHRGAVEVVVGAQPASPSAPIRCSPMAERIKMPFLLGERGPRQVQVSKHERASCFYSTLNPPTPSVDPGFETVKTPQEAPVGFAADVRAFCEVRSTASRSSFSGGSVQFHRHSIDGPST